MTLHSLSTKGLHGELIEPSPGKAARKGATPEAYKMGRRRRGGI